MSVQAISWALAQQVRPSGAKLLLIAIANYANDSNAAWPSKATLAKDTCMSKQAVLRHLRDLQAQGLVTIEERKLGNTNLSSVIWLLMEGSGQRTEVEHDGMVDDGGRQPELPTRQPELSTVGNQSCQGVGNQSCPEPLLRTVIEPDSVSSLERDIVTAFNEWNTLARKHGLPTAHKLTSARKSKLRARLRSDGLDGWRRALDKLSRSSFCLGLKGDWRASLDFVLQESSFTKLLEGTYDDNQANGNGAGMSEAAIDLERWNTRLRYARDNGKWADSWGPMPGQSGCLVPEQLLQRGDGHGWKPLEIRREERGAA